MHGLSVRTWHHAPPFKTKGLLAKFVGLCYVPDRQHGGNGAVVVPIQRIDLTLGCWTHDCLLWVWVESKTEKLSLSLPVDRNCTCRTAIIFLTTLRYTLAPRS